jgi:hypothetical protein
MRLEWLVQFRKFEVSIESSLMLRNKAGSEAIIGIEDYKSQYELKGVNTS